MKKCEQCGKRVQRRNRNTEGLLVCPACCKATSKQKPLPFSEPQYKSVKPAQNQGISKSLRKHAKQPPHVIVEALAGTGKTTTLIEGMNLLRGLPTSITPSPQQEAIWDAMAASKGAQRVCFAAFNSSIAKELQDRVPPACEAKTIHSLGYGAVRNAYPTLKQVSQYKSQDILSEIYVCSRISGNMGNPILVCAVEKLVGLCKLNLINDPDDQALAELADYYDIELNHSAGKVFNLVPQVLEASKDVMRYGCDFDDMVWLPVVLGLPVPEYDLLLIDEAQDLNRCQQALVRKAGRRLIFCGDPCQAIYGFAGADCESMERLQAELEATPEGCIHLPLTVTYRCGKAIVKEAQKIVPNFEAHESNVSGIVGQLALDARKETCYMESVRDHDMILCRVNAPLVSQCFRFIKAGRKSHIQGKDIGQGLVAMVKKSKATTVEQLVVWLGDWLDTEQREEHAKRNPRDAWLIALEDRHDCLLAFTEECKTTVEVIAKIESVFSDDRNGGILLSSVHKAKGLEANRVFILLPKNAGMPHPMAKSGWQIKQEWNLRYVAITRAIEELVYVS